MKKIVVTGIVVFLTILFLLSSVSATWWNDSWNYKKPVEITGTRTDTGTIIEVVVNTSAISDKIRSDGYDIRFVNETSNTVLEVHDFKFNLNGLSTYYIRTNETTVQSDNIYMYYNNSAASNVFDASSIYTTMDRFNRADSGTVGNSEIDGTAWTEVETCSISGNELYVDGIGSGGAGYTYITNTLLSSYSGGIIQMRHPSSGNNNESRFYMPGPTDNYRTTVTIMNGYFTYVTPGDFYTAFTPALVANDGQNYTVSIQHDNSTSYTVWIDGVQKVTGAAYTTEAGSGGRILLFSAEGTAGGGHTYFDDLRKFNKTDFGASVTIGGELSLHTPIISNKQPTTPISKYVNSSDFSINATTSLTSNNKWEIDNVLEEWDNSTTSPAYTFSPSTKGFGDYTVKLTAYNTTNPAYYSSTTWDVSVTWAWSRTLVSQFSMGLCYYGSNLLCGDIDNDGTEECLAVGRDANQLVILELDGTNRTYNVQDPYMAYWASLKDIDEDGQNEVIYTYAITTEAEVDLYQFNATHINQSSVNNVVGVTSDNPHGIGWLKINGDWEFYTGYCGGGEVTHIELNFTGFDFTQIDTVANSGEGTLVFDIDNDGVDELVVNGGFAAGSATVYIYEINNATGAYTTKTTVLSASLDTSTHYSVYLTHGDVDNDGIENLIVLWEPDDYSVHSDGIIEAYEFNTSYASGYAEGFLIANTGTGFVENGDTRTYVVDVDGDGENELLAGIWSYAQEIPAVLAYYEIGVNGSSIEKHTIYDFETDYFAAGTSNMVVPSIVNDSGTIKIACIVNNGTIADFYLFERAEAPAPPVTTPSISNVTTDSISATSQWVAWDVNQTAHNRWKYSLYENMSFELWSAWDNSTASPNITVSTLTSNTKYYYQAWSYNTTNTSLTDNSTTANFTTAFVPPVITLLSQTPSVIYQNSTGYLNISYGITHDSSGLNNTSVSFIYRDYDHTLNNVNHSIRPPENNRSAIWSYNGRILRGANRNETLNFENNDTITGGDIYTWSGLDENNTRLTIVPVNSTYTKVYINGTVHDLMPQMWYLDRSDLQEAPKTQLGIHKHQNVLIKFWNFEVFKNNYDFLGVGYTDTGLNVNPALYPSDANPLDFYYVNSSYDPVTGGDPVTSGYAVYMGSLNATGWIDHVYKPHVNSSYVRGFINNSLLHSYITTTNISYLYFTSDTPSSKPYYINVTNAASSTNISFADTNVLWAGDVPPYAAQAYTPNIWFSFMKTNISFDHKIYVADNNNQWANSTLNSTFITKALFPPTRPTFYSFHDGFTDYDMNRTYSGTFDIQIGTSSDPDGGTVTHNLTLHYGVNNTYVATINNTFYMPNGVFANISFDSSPYYSSDNYTLRLIATDDESESVTVWLGVNFILNPPTLTIGGEQNIKEDWGQDFSSNFSANVTGQNAKYVWMNFSHNNFTNTGLGWLNISANEWVNQSHNVGSPITNVSVNITLNSTTADAINGTASFYYEITKRNNTATMDSAATQSVGINQDFFINASLIEEYSDTFYGVADLLEDGTVILTNSSIIDYVNFTHNESVVSVYNYTVRFYNLTHYNNITTPTYSNVTVSDLATTPSISGEYPTSPVQNDTSESSVTFGATINQSSNNQWIADFGGGNITLEWDNSTSSPAYTNTTFNQTEGHKSYTIYLKAYNSSNSLFNTSTSWIWNITDVTPPASITSLTNSTYVITYINWTWTNPTNGDFNHTMVYIDNSFEINVSSPYYNDTGLSGNTQYNISTHTVDTSGNINTTWVNVSATTAPYSLEYNISGYVKNGTDSPIIDVDIANNITGDTDKTNASGFYNLTGLYNNTYLVTASKGGYVSNSTVVTISGSDMTNQNITLTEIPGAPNIIVWWNNYTKNNLTSFVVGYTQEANRTIFFNVTANQSINYWVWYKDDVLVQNSSSDNYTATWDFGGSYTIKVYGINTNGQTDTIVWNIKIQNTLYEQNLLLLEENSMIGTSMIFGIFVVLAFIFLVLGLLEVGYDFYMDIVMLFISPTIFLMLGYQCYISEALLEFEFAGLLLVIMATIIYIYAVVKIFGIAAEEFGYGEKEEDRGADYEYK